MADTSEVPAPERLVLHGIADLGALKVIGPRGVECARVPVRAIKEGRVVALVSMAPEPRKLPPWLSWLPRPALPSGLPVSAALSSLLPVLPVADGTVFESEAQLRQMLLARESEITGFVADHARYVECDLTAGFKPDAAEAEISASGPLSGLIGMNEGERQLIERSKEQVIAGRRGAFFARIRRRVIDGSIDALAADHPPGIIKRRVLVAREARADFRKSLLSILDDAGAGAWLRLGPYRPPASFRRLDISSAQPDEVDAARSRLGVEATTNRGAIRVAYERSLERTYSSAMEQDRHARLKSFESSFGLLSLVAEGQMRASRESVVRLDTAALKSTWLLKLHMHDLADKAA